MKLSNLTIQIMAIKHFFSRGAVYYAVQGGPKFYALR